MNTTTLKMHIKADFGTERMEKTHIFMKKYISFILVY